LIRLCFLIRQLNTGGAQRQLVTLLEGLDSSQFAVTLITFYDGGRFRDQVRDMPHLEYVCIDKRSRWDVFGFMGRLLHELRCRRPHVLHGYLATSNLLAVVLKPWLQGTRIVWGIRGSYMDFSQYEWTERLLFRLECLCARFADLVISNSEAGRKHCLAHGFSNKRIVVIPNGIDTDQFQPDEDARRQVREAWGVGTSEHLIGLVGRLDPIKDHATFLQAAAQLVLERSDVRFVCIGDGPADYSAQLQAQGTALGLAEKLIWAGARSDMSAVQNALDIATSSSLGEGFPNAIGEAMACGVPCVVTDVGDSAWIVGDTGIVVPAGDAAALAAGWVTCLAWDSGEQGQKARTRIVDDFSVPHLARRTEEALWPKV
jgi:glycosyltransferase involved in cell wall biosynthesis